MNEPTSDVLAERARFHTGGRQTVAWSIAGHGVVLALIVLAARNAPPPPVRQVMTVSLSGAPGERTGGFTPMASGAAAPVTPKPPAPTPPPEEPRPAPPKAVVPPRPAARPTSATPAARMPASAPEPATSSAPVFAGAPRQGFGLSSSGGSAGKSVELNVSNFCCPDYLEKMVLAIQRGWEKNQGVTGVSVVAFTIRRDGTVDSPSVGRPSGFFALDNAALRAVTRATLPPLPPEFRESTLGVRLTFEYQQ
jgi:periplasmic protein TonB